MTSHDEWTTEAFAQETREYVPTSKWGEDLKPQSLKRMEDVGGHYHYHYHTITFIILL